MLALLNRRRIYSFTKNQRKRQTHLRGDLEFPEHVVKDLRCKSLTKAPQGATGGCQPVLKELRGIPSNALSKERKCPPVQGLGRRGQELFKVGDLYGFCDWDTLDSYLAYFRESRAFEGFNPKAYRHSLSYYIRIAVVILTAVRSP